MPLTSAALVTLLAAIAQPAPAARPAPPASSQGAEMIFVHEPSEAAQDIDVIHARGIITRDSARRLEALLATIDGSSSVMWIDFDSTGGDLAGAIELGRMIRRLHLRTAVGESGCDIAPTSGTCPDAEFSRMPTCVSACAYAFLGGMERALTIWDESLYLSHNSVERQRAVLDSRYRERRNLGFHQFHQGDAVISLRTDGAVQALLNMNSSQSQITASDLARYISDMGIDLRILSVASNQDPRGMSFPDLDDLISMRVLARNRFDDFRLVPDGSGVSAVSMSTGRGAATQQVSFHCTSGTGGAAHYISLVYSRPKVAQGRDWITPGENPAMAAISTLRTLRVKRGNEFSDFQLPPIANMEPWASIRAREIPLLVEAPPLSYLDHWSVDFNASRADGAALGFPGSEVRVYADRNWEHFEARPTREQVREIVAQRFLTFRFTAPNSASLWGIPPIEITAEGARHIEAAVAQCMAAAPALEPPPA